jgi:S-adenosylmethionine:tRNA ribosyltransferase-isomerase
MLHLSTHLPADLWTVELRSPEGAKPLLDGKPGEKLRLPGGGAATLQTAYLPQNRSGKGPNRLWISTLDLPTSLSEYLERHGSPIVRLRRGGLPSGYYQTVYATEKGSAEMPLRAGRSRRSSSCASWPKGVQVAPLILHTGRGQPEDDEPPYEEFYRVPPRDAQRGQRGPRGRPPGGGGWDDGPCGRWRP